MAQADTATSTKPDLAAAHNELGDLEETIRDMEMYAGLLAAADTDDGTARAGGKLLDLIKEIERVREMAWQATGSVDDGQ